MRLSKPWPFLAALWLVACGHTMTTDEAVADLHDGYAKVRLRAADSLRSGGVVPASAVPALLLAVDGESDPDVRGSLLLTLAASGAPDAKPILEQAVRTAPNDGARKTAERALDTWTQKSDAPPKK